MCISEGKGGGVFLAALARALRRAAMALVSCLALRTLPCGLMTISGGSIWREKGAEAVGVWCNWVEVMGNPGAGSAWERSSISLSVRGVMVWLCVAMNWEMWVEHWDREAALSS